MDFSLSPPSTHLDAEIRRKIDGKTKPPGALGRIEALALQLCRIQTSLFPVLRSPCLLLFAGDHGAAQEGVSAYPQEVTWQMVLNFLNGGAAINVFARRTGMVVKVVDAGVRHEFADHADLICAKVAPGTRNYVVEPAMSGSQCEQAVLTGRRLVAERAALGSNVIGFGEMGIGNSASAALLLHRLGGLPLEVCVGRGTGLDDAGLMRKRAVLARASARCAGVLAPLEALVQFGGFEIAMMAGAFFEAARQHMVVLVDGFIASAALLVAANLQPAVLEYCVFSHRSAEAGHVALLELLQASPLLELDLRLGEGTGAALALPLLQAAADMVNDMASFADAGVSGAR